MRNLMGMFRLSLEDPPPPLMCLKTFKAENPEVPKLDSYSNPPPEGWWEKWPKLSWEEGKLQKSNVNPDRMISWADKAAHPDMDLVLQIARDLRKGCDLGTRGVALCPSTSTNAPSALEYGDRVTDSIVQGIKDKIMIGPLEEHELPFKDEGIKVNGIMVKLKETGSARIILNLSRGAPFSVNGGQDVDQMFEFSMSDTTGWLRALHKAGLGCWICKLDWTGIT